MWAANTWNTGLDRTVLAELQDMLYRNHPGVQWYKHAFELTKDMPSQQQCKIALRFDKNTDRRRYNLSTTGNNEIAVILPGDGDQPEGTRDIILYRNHADGGLQRISDIHPAYPSLHYVLLFPTGQLTWHPYIKFNNTEHDGDNSDDGNAEEGSTRRSHMSRLEYWRYRLHQRPAEVESQHIFLSGKLFQEFICDTWATAEQSNLNYITSHHIRRTFVLMSIQDWLMHQLAVQIQISTTWARGSFFLHHSKTVHVRCSSCFKMLWPSIVTLEAAIFFLP